jgi:molybdenum cofactor synthesis domain-containing protein
VTIPTILIVVSDRAAKGERADATAGLLRPVLAESGCSLDRVIVVPDERERISVAILDAAKLASLVLTTGGTGVAPRDVTPEATRDVLTMEVPGLGEEMRRRSAETNPKALGSRAVGGILDRSVVLNLPGRPEGAVECFRHVASALGHLVHLRRGPVPDASHRPGSGGGLR